MYRKSTPLRFIKKRLFLFFLIFILLGIFFVDKYDKDLTFRLRQQIKLIIDKSSLPVKELIAYGSNKINYYYTLRNAVAENEILKERIKLLQLKLQETNLLRHENKKLKQHLNIPEPFGYHYLTATINDFGGTPFSKSMTINAGKNHNIETDQPVLSPDGLVGRIFSVYDNYSSILLIQDINSRIPVKIKNKNINLICSGTNSNKLKLLYAGRNIENITPGDKVETSGDGGIFPSGLIVGEVSYIENNIPIVETNFGYNYLGIVRILQRKK